MKNRRPDLGSKATLDAAPRPSASFRTVTHSVRGEKAAAVVADRLVGSWFECEPFPDDVYKFTVKVELDGLLRGLIWGAEELAKTQTR
jgi:hypothetical protein